jgi:hypothetical protein
MRTLLLSALFLPMIACGGSTEPKGGDPSLLFSNSTSAPVYLTWQDGQQIFGRDTIPPHTVGHCSRFLAQPDSAQFEITASENGGLSTYTAPFFDPAARPAWTVDVSSDRTGGTPNITVNLVDTPC